MLASLAALSRQRRFCCFSIDIDCQTNRGSGLHHKPTTSTDSRVRTMPAWEPRFQPDAISVAMNSWPIGAAVSSQLRFIAHNAESKSLSSVSTARHRCRIHVPVAARFRRMPAHAAPNAAATTGRSTSIQRIPVSFGINKNVAVTNRRFVSPTCGFGSPSDSQRCRQTLNQLT